MKKKYAFISGASQGIGYHISKNLIKENYIVIINGRSHEKITHACSQLGTNAIPFICDLTDFKELPYQLKKHLGSYQFDLVISNIGTGRYSNNAIVDIEEWVSCFNTNFFQAINLFNHMSGYFNSKSAQFISIASIAGCEDIGAPTPYQSAKASLIMAMKSLSRKVANQNIRVNCISPGNVFCENGIWDRKLQENRKDTENYIHNNVPLNKFINPEEIAETVLFLEKNSSITGSNIIVDAGQTKKF